MKANISRKRHLDWSRQKQCLQQDGSVFKYNPSPSSIPLSKPLVDICPSQRSFVALHTKKHLARCRKCLRSHQSQECHDGDGQVHAVGNRKLQEPLINIHIGGIRGDPFDTFPIANTGHVPGAFDYFAEVYAPLGIRPPHNETPESRSRLLRSYFCTLLEDDMFFEQVIAFSLAVQQVNQNSKERLSKAVMYHMSNAMTHLRLRMTLGQATSTAAILTIISLAAVSVIGNDFKSFDVHAAGIRQVVHLRGGHDNLGWDGYIKGLVLVVEKMQTARASLLEKQTMDSARPVSIDNPLDYTTKLVYPSHPFPPFLCAKISRLPIGFRELALSTRLSYTYIDALPILTTWSLRQHSMDKDDIQTQDADPPALLALSIGSISDLTLTERLLATTFLAWTVWVKKRQGDTDGSPISRVQLRAQGRIFKNEQRLAGKCDSRFVAWTCEVIRIVAEEGTELREWADRMAKPTGGNAGLAQLFVPIPTAEMIGREH